MPSTRELLYNHLQASYERIFALLQNDEEFTSIEEDLIADHIYTELGFASDFRPTLISFIQDQLVVLENIDLIAASNEEETTALLYFGLLFGLLERISDPASGAELVALLEQTNDAYFNQYDNLPSHIIGLAADRADNPFWYWVLYRG